MKYLPVLLLLAIPFYSFGQKYVTTEGEFMDTTDNRNDKCIDANLYYYQIGCKYPKSSSTLLIEVQKYMQGSKIVSTESGYITFRARIDCEGHPVKKVQVLQTDEQYKKFHFDKAYVNELYLYFVTLDNWKTISSYKGSFYYTAFITFKIRNGKVINITP